MLKRIILLNLLCAPIFLSACHDCIEDLEYQKEIYEEFIDRLDEEFYQDDTTFYSDRLRSYLYAFYNGKVEAINLALQIIKENHPRLNYDE